MTDNDLQSWLATFSMAITQELDAEVDEISSSEPGSFAYVYNELKIAFLKYFRENTPVTAKFLSAQYKSCQEITSTRSFFTYYLSISFGMQRNEFLSQHPLADFFANTMRLMSAKNQALDVKSLQIIPIWTKGMAFSFLLQISLEDAIKEFFNSDFDQIFKQDSLKAKFKDFAPKLSVLKTLLEPYKNISLVACMEEAVKLLEEAKENENTGLYFSQLLIYGIGALALIVGTSVYRQLDKIKQWNPADLLKVVILGGVAISVLLGIFTGIYYCARFVTGLIESPQRSRRLAAQTETYVSKFDEKIAAAVEKNPKTLNAFLTKLERQNTPPDPDIAPAKTPIITL
jgi:hypothetical protein